MNESSGTEICLRQCNRWGGRRNWRTSTMSSTRVHSQSLGEELALGAKFSHNLSMLKYFLAIGDSRNIGILFELVLFQ
jgi:hypothetical protein